MKKTFILIAVLLSTYPLIGQEVYQELTEADIEAYNHTLDSIENSFSYQYGEVRIGENIARLSVPSGYKYLDTKQSKYVLIDLWGNPPEETLGLLFKEDESPICENFTYVIEIQYSNDGFVSDEDSEDIDYEELLEEMQKSAIEANPERVKAGYPSIQLVGWAAPPYYDAKNKKLHWAKELNFDDTPINTLNYNIRILGRRGYLLLNIIGDMDVLPDINRDINKIQASIEFTFGNTYSDFDPKFDQVSAYGIGGLIAGKVLAKVGFFALVAKFWKLIALGAIGVLAGLRKKLFGRKKEEEMA
ncbi:MAG: DUF2167 domain-containing protein [Bacteroidales bacterium]|nr:DUF2167 domain-containing protein [Bacteroidales bacterium]MCF8455877.1 DUF2167 domain-containing protein [Bacteroidales bacterium]